MLADARKVRDTIFVLKKLKFYSLGRGMYAGNVKDIVWYISPNLEEGKINVYTVRGPIPVWVDISPYFEDTTNPTIEELTIFELTFGVEWFVPEGGI